MTHPIEQWHALLDSKNINDLDNLLDEDCVFLSPVVHTPQKGKKLTKMYLSGAFMVFSTSPFEYVKEIIGENQAALEFQTEIDGISINGIDIITWNDAGKFTEFKVMLRPLKAVNLMHQKMQVMLGK